MGMFPYAAPDQPSGAIENKYKYLMTKIERLCFPFVRGWRKFFANYRGPEEVAARGKENSCADPRFGVLDIHEC
jgi:hypothetical protein